jgi:3'-phosphoadenosine 5'-phosphosulfate (PAPS) 3'-phosphatase
VNRPHVSGVLAPELMLLRTWQAFPQGCWQKISMVDLEVQRAKETAQLCLVLETSHKEEETAETLADHHTHAWTACSVRVP